MNQNMYSVIVNNFPIRNKVLFNTDTPTEAIRDEVLPDILKKDIDNILPNNIRIQQTIEKFRDGLIPHFIITIS